MLIKVTKQDIKKGVRYSFRNCPVARAVKRATKITNVYVVGPSIMMNEQRFRVSRAVDEFQCRFDGKKPVKPFSFRLSYEA